MRKDWKVKKLGDVCISDLGKTLNKSKDTGLLLPYLCSINVQWNKIDLSTQKEALFEENDIKKYSVKKGDLLVCEGGDIGRAAIWSEDYSMLYQNALHRIRLDKNIIAEYVLYFLWQLKRKGVLDKRYAKGVTIKHLVKSSLLSINIPVPPLQIQQQIVEEFDRLTSIIEKQKKQLEELDKLAESIFYDMFGDPIVNEKGWNVKTMDNICNITSSKRIYSHEYVEAGIPFYRGKEITEKCKSLNLSVELFISVERYEELKENFGVPQIGDLLLTAVGTIGNIWIVDTETPFYFKDGNILWLKKLVNITPVFFKYLLELQISESKNKLANGCAYNALTIMNLKILSVITPPLPLQQQFASKIEAIEKQKELIKKSIKETEGLFNSRMDYYFN